MKWPILSLLCFLPSVAGAMVLPEKCWDYDGGSLPEVVAEDLKQTDLQSLLICRHVGGSFDYSLQSRPALKTDGVCVWDISHYTEIGPKHDVSRWYREHRMQLATDGICPPVDIRRATEVFGVNEHSFALVQRALTGPLALALAPPDQREVLSDAKAVQDLDAWALEIQRSQRVTFLADGRITKHFRPGLWASVDTGSGHWSVQFAPIGDDLKIVAVIRGGFNPYP